MDSLSILVDGTDQIFCQSSTSRPSYALRRRDWSARVIPALAPWGERVGWSALEVLTHKGATQPVLSCLSMILHCYQ